MAIDLKAILRLDDQMSSKLSSATRQLEKTSQAVKRMDGAFQDSAGRWRKANGQYMTTAEKTAAGIGGVDSKVNKLNKSLNKTGYTANRLSSSFGSFGSKLAGLAGFTGLTAGLASSVKLMAYFDTSIRKAGAIADASSAELTQMGEVAKKLGADTSKSATEVANAMTELAAKGFNAQQVMKAMPGIIAASEASGEDLALTSDTVASALNIWSLEASKSSHIADVLAMAANKTAAGVQDMHYAFKYAGAPAKALGLSLEELSAAVGLITNAGIDGSTAGTSLRQGLSMLVGPSNESQKSMDKVGFSAYDASGKVKSMVEIVASLKDAMKGMNKGEKIVFMKSLVGTESLSSFLSLVDAGPAKLEKLQKSLENSDGAAASASKKMKAGIGGALEQASGAIETFMINVGDKFAPAVTKIANTISSMDTQPAVDAIAKIGNAVKVTADFVITNWSSIREAVISAGAAFVTFRGLMAGMTIIMTITKMVNAYKLANIGATTAQALFNGVLFANPIGLVIAAIAALIGIIVYLTRNWDTVTKRTRTFWHAIGGGQGAIRIILGPLGVLIGAAIDLAKNWDSTKSVWENVWGAMKRSAAATVNSVIGGINQMIGVINKIPGVNIPVIAKVNWGSQAVSDAKATARTIGNGGHAVQGFAGGISRVPYDGMPARLHEGERVLTKEQNKAYSNGSGGSTFHITVTGNTFAGTIEEQAEQIFELFVNKVEQAGGAGS